MDFPWVVALAGLLWAAGGQAAVTATANATLGWYSATATLPGTVHSRAEASRANSVRTW